MHLDVSPKLCTVQGIWDYNALPQYIYILEDSSSQAVGLIEGIQGTCTALFGFPGAGACARMRLLLHMGSAPGRMRRCSSHAQPGWGGKQHACIPRKQSHEEP